MLVLIGVIQVPAEFTNAAVIATNTKTYTKMRQTYQSVGEQPINVQQANQMLTTLSKRLNTQPVVAEEMICLNFKPDWKRHKACEPAHVDQPYHVARLVNNECHQEEWRWMEIRRGHEWIPWSPPAIVDCFPKSRKGQNKFDWWKFESVDNNSDEYQNELVRPHQKTIPVLSKEERISFESEIINNREKRERQNKKQENAIINKLKKDLKCFEDHSEVGNRIFKLTSIRPTIFGRKDLTEKEIKEIEDRKQAAAKRRGVSGNQGSSAASAK